MTEREHARYLLKEARFKLSEAKGYVRTVGVGQGDMLANEIGWLIEDITAHLNDYDKADSAVPGRDSRARRHIWGTETAQGRGVTGRQAV